jgi:hypothetical protein
LRKSFMAAGAAALLIGGAATAYAQVAPPAITVTASVSPSKSGTKKKPKATSLNLKVVNNVDQSKATASQIKITLPSTLKLSTKGLPQCTKDDNTILNTAGAACKTSKAGGGSSDVILNPYTSPAKITFSVTSIVGKNELLFYLTSPVTKAVLHGKISGRTLTIRIPDGSRPGEPNLQQPAPGAYSAIANLTTKLSLKKGKHSLLTSVGCSGGAHKVTVSESFVNNPTPPAATSATASGKATCKK